MNEILSYLFCMAMWRIWKEKSPFYVYQVMGAICLDDSPPYLMEVMMSLAILYSPQPM